MLRRAAILGAIVAALASAPAASAATKPIDLGPGTGAHAAIDSAGVAHLTWAERTSGQDVAHYCKLPQGAPACTSPHDFTYPTGPNLGTDSGVWPLLPGDPRVLVIDARCCSQYAAKFVYASTDGGATFDAGTNTGNDNNLGAAIDGSAIYTPAGSLGRAGESIATLGFQATIGLSFQAIATTGAPASTSASNVLTQGDALSGSLGVSGTSTLVAAWYHLDDSTVYWRQWGGSGDVNDSATWTPITPLDAGNIDSAPQLAYGRAGIFIAYNAGASGADRTVVRHFNGTGWDAPTTLVTPGARRFAIAEKPDGTLHVVYSASDGGLRYRFSTTPGDSSFSPPLPLAPPGNYVDVRVSAGNTGWVTWEDGSPAHTFALPFKPSAIPPPTEGRSVNVVPTKGSVFVKLPAGAINNPKAGSGGFVPLQSVGSQIPVGSTLDTRKGTVRLFAATNSAGRTQHGDFSRGLFTISQARKNPLTTVSMTGGGLRSCGRVPPGGSPKPSAGAGAVAARKRRRSLFSNVHGHFTTRGRNSAATVRGTAFTMTDTCTGTLTRVQRGTVLVRDFWLRKTRRVRAGHSYLARRGNR